jgi:hypothetical protein
LRIEGELNSHLGRRKIKPRIIQSSKNWKRREQIKRPKEFQTTQE